MVFAGVFGGFSSGAFCGIIFCENAKRGGRRIFFRRPFFFRPFCGCVILGGMGRIRDFLADEERNIPKFRRAVETGSSYAKAFLRSFPATVEGLQRGRSAAAGRDALYKRAQRLARSLGFSARPKAAAVVSVPSVVPQNAGVNAEVVDAPRFGSQEELEKYLDDNRGLFQTAADEAKFLRELLLINKREWKHAVVCADPKAILVWQKASTDLVMALRKCDSAGGDMEDPEMRQMLAAALAADGASDAGGGDVC